MHRVRVSPQAAREHPVRVRGAELRHLRDVLRLRAGDRIELFDGEGSGWIAEILSVGVASADVALLEPIAHPRESPLALTLAVGLLKGAKLDWVVEKATELGVTRLVPFVSARSVARTARVARWRTIAAAAAAQSGRVAYPAIDEVCGLSAVLALRSAHERAVLFWEEGTAPLERDARPAASALVVTGPEGGFTAAEATQAATAGFAIARLGPRVLRAETAPLVAAALAQFLWGDLAA